MNIPSNQYLGQLIGPIEKPMPVEEYDFVLEYPGKWTPPWEVPLDPRTPGISPGEDLPQPEPSAYDRSKDPTGVKPPGRGFAIAGVTIAVIAATAFFASR